jgi:hypothetical protein
MNKQQNESAELRDLCGEVAVGIISADDDESCGCPKCIENDKLVRFAARCTLAVVLHEKFAHAQEQQTTPKPAA